MNEWIPGLQHFVGLEYEPLVTFITDWGGPLGTWIVLQLVVIFAGLSAGLRLALIATIAFITNGWLKWSFLEPRPFHVNHELVTFGAERGFGMPSGHAQGAAAFWGAMGWMWRQKTGALLGLVLFAIVVGLTRVYLGLHSPLQVMVGLLFGFVIAYIVLAAWPRMSQGLQAVTWARRWLILAAGIGLMFAVSEIILSLGDGFVVPQLWIEGYARAEGVTHVSADDLAFFSNPTVLIGGMGAGYGAMALLAEKWPIELMQMRLKWLALLGAVLMNGLFIGVIGLLLGLEVGALAFFMAFLHPLLTLYLPMRLLHKSASTPEEGGV